MAKAVSFMLFITVLLPSFGTGPKSVVINEIAWMGTNATSYDEWLELRNTTTIPINLTNWIIQAEDGTPIITLEGEIPAMGFYLLERSDDLTISDISADQIFTGALDNSGELLFLKDESGAIIDEINCATGWYGGDNESKSTMERIHPETEGSDAGNWGTNNGIIINGMDASSQPLNGTPKAQNSIYDDSLPVTLIFFKAIVLQKTIKVTWQTGADNEIIGFHLLRANDENGDYLKISPFITVHSSPEKEYVFIDSEVFPGRNYWYKLIVVRANSHQLSYGPIKSANEIQDDTKSHTFHFYNYPNPFNPETTFHYYLPEETANSEISIIVFNLLGNPVYHFLQRRTHPGVYSLRWNGLDRDGNTVPSGIYFCQLNCNQEMVLSHRMIKLK